jgi:hypothetical protein
MGFESGLALIFLGLARDDPRSSASSAFYAANQLLIPIPD